MGENQNGGTNACGGGFNAAVAGSFFAGTVPGVRHVNLDLDIFGGLYDEEPPGAYRRGNLRKVCGSMGESVVTRYKTIRCYGIGEEELRQKLAEFIEREEPQLRIVNKGAAETDIVLSASGDIEDEAKAKIKPVYKEIKALLGEKVFSTKENISLEMAVVKLLEEHDISIATAESCTGGMLAAKMIDVPGVSEVFREGFITYTNKAKRKSLNVSKMTLKKYGAVSEQTAKEMAMGAVSNSGADASLAVTGIAGPDGGTPTKPVGLVYIACYLNHQVKIEEHHFSGSRKEVRSQSVDAALDLLRRSILEQHS